MHRQPLNHSCLGGRPHRHSDHTGPGESVPHSRSAHQSTRATCFVRPGEVRTGASRLFAQLERYATPLGGPPAEPRWSTSVPTSRTVPSHAMTAAFGDAVLPGLRPAPSVDRTRAGQPLPTLQ